MILPTCPQSHFQGVIVVVDLSLHLIDLPFVYKYIVLQKMWYLRVSISPSSNDLEDVLKFCNDQCSISLDFCFCSELCCWHSGHSGYCLWKDLLGGSPLHPAFMLSIGFCSKSIFRYIFDQLDLSMWICFFVSVEHDSLFPAWSTNLLSPVCADSAGPLNWAIKE